MDYLKYTIIKTKDQYHKYCNTLEELVFSDAEKNEDEIELLTLLIEKYDTDNSFFSKLNPVETIKSLMKDHKLKSKDLAEILDLSTGTVSKILNYQKGLSKETIRKLASFFKMQQEAFNRPYKLTSKVNKLYRNVNQMNTIKDLSDLIPA